MLCETTRVKTRRDLGHINCGDLEGPRRARSAAPANARGATALAGGRLVRGLRSTSAEVSALAPLVGNRAIVRLLARQPNTDPPAATTQTTWQNRDLARRIDQLRKLDNAGLTRARERLGAQPSMSDPARAPREGWYVQELRAIEWVSAERGLPVVPTATASEDPMELERFAAKVGSFKQAKATSLYFNPQLADDPHWTGRRTALEHRADQFIAEFESQARQNAEALLKESLVSIKKVLESYGLPADHVVSEAGEHSTKDVIASTMRLAHLGDWATTYKRKADVRLRFAAAVLEVKAKQDTVRTLKGQIQLWEGKIQHPQDISPYSDETPESLQAKVVQLRPQLVAAQNELATTWIEAERQDEVFAAYRTGEDLDELSFSDLEHMIDLGRPDEGDANMAAVLGELVPKVANIKEAWPWIHQKKVSPLTLPPIIEMTRRYMFVAPGSFTAAVLNDAVEDANSKGFVRWLIEAVLLALSVLAAIPSGGASLVLPAAAASVMYGVYSAMDEYVKYGRGQAFANTAIDRARSLSDQEPSLTGFVVSLIGAGLDAIPLAHAFGEAVALRRAVMAGEDATEVVARLNKLGSDHNLGNIGSDVERTAKADQAAAEAATKPPAPQPPGTPKPKAAEPPKPKATEPPKPKPPEPPKAKPPDAEPAGAKGAGKEAGKPPKAGDEREVAGGARVRYRAGGRRTLCINPCAELDHLGLSDDEIDNALRYLGTVPGVDTRAFVETLAAFKGTDDIPIIQSMVRSLSRSKDAASAAASAADLLDRIAHLRQIEGYKFNLSELAAAHARGDAILAHGPLQTPEFVEDIQWGGRPVGEWKMDNGRLSFPNRRPLSQHRLPPQLESLDFVIVENERGSGLRLIMGRNHSGLSGGKAYVFAAGEFRFSSTGELVAITRMSGHYRPALQNLERAREFLRQHNMLSPRGVELIEAVP